MTKRIQFYLFIVLFLQSYISQAQDMVPDVGRAFQTDEVPHLDIILHPDSLAWILDPAHSASNYHFHADFIFSDSERKDTLTNVGFRIRGNTSRGSAKKSFKVSFNTYVSGRKWEGLEKLNLNGEHNDPTVSRSKIGWDILREMELPASRANHVELYINGVYFGVYLNTEHIDEEFVDLRFGNKDGNLYKCLWPADLAYEGSDPNIYKTLGTGSRQAYELKTNTAENDYSDLAHLIDVLNNTSLGNRACEFEKVLNVESFLKAYAFEVLIGHWDNYAYNKNNFYLYKNTATGRFEYIPYDLDNTLGIDWLNRDWTTRNVYEWSRTNANRPLVNELLEVPRYREQFTAILDELIKGIFEPSEIFPKIDSVRQLVRPSVINDTYYTLDYGFSIDDFDESFNTGVAGYQQTRWGIKEFINLRTAATFVQLVPVVIRPVIKPIVIAEMTAYTQLGFKVLVENSNTLQSLVFAWPTNAGTQFYDMKDDGVSNDAFKNDGIYGVQVPMLLEDIGNFPFYLQVFDNQGDLHRYPICGFDSMEVKAGQNSIFINEIMAKNTNGIIDEADEYEDWIELYFANDAYQNVENLYLTDDESQPEKWKLPAESYNAGYHLFWADGEESEGTRHANFKLDSNGEFIGLFEKNPDGSFFRHDGLYFGVQMADVAYARLPNQIGAFNEALATPLAQNQSLVSVLEGINEANSYTVSPNPSKGLFYINLHESIGNAEVFLYNSLGNELQIPYLDKKEIGVCMDLKGLPNGVYFLKYKGILQKLIKI